MTLALTLLASLGLAQSADGERYAPSPFGGILSTQGARWATDAVVRGGLAVSFASRPVVGIDDGGRTRDVVGSRLTLIGQAAYAAGPFDVGVRVPVGFQSGEVGGAGLADVSVAGRLRFLRGDNAALAVFAAGAFPTAGGAAYLGRAGVAADVGVGGVVVAGPATLFADLGAQIAGSSRVADLDLGTDLFTRVAGAFAVARSVDVLVEVVGSTSAVVPLGPGLSHLEFRAALSVPLGPFRIEAGWGKGLSDGFGTPAWRVFGGVGYAPSPLPPEPKAEASPVGSHDLGPDRAPRVIVPAPPTEEAAPAAVRLVPAPAPAAEPTFVPAPPAAEPSKSAAPSAPALASPQGRNSFEPSRNPPEPRPPATVVPPSGKPPPARPAVKPRKGDRDGDGVGDAVDKCPDEPGINDAFLRGCPEIPVVPIIRMPGRQ